MIKEIKAPSPGESISEIEISVWFVKDGDIVQKDQEIAEIESEKATLPLIADESGQIKILKQTGEAIPVGEVLCTIDTSKAGDINSSAKTETNEKGVLDSEETGKVKSEKDEEKVIEEKKVSISEKASRDKNDQSDKKPEEKGASSSESLEKVKVTPVAKKMMEEYELSIEDVIKGLKKINSSDIKWIREAGTSGSTLPGIVMEGSREENHTRMSLLRRKLSERLVAVKNETAMLTTFNEADMSRIIAIRKKYQEQFIKEHDIKLGFMSFFVKACALALKLFPMVNSRIEGEEIVTPDYCDIGIAVQAEKGLMVPVLRNAEAMTLSQIEKEIAILAGKARNNRISIEDMSGGTFTITNGGVFGSMMSTPILNPPQAAILGMHNIIERPVAIDGQVVIRPMMYLALSYDHRIIDGKESVSFLVKVKEMLENPERMLMGGGDAELVLLDLPV